MTPDIQELKRLAEAAHGVSGHSYEAHKAQADYSAASRPSTILALIEIAEAAQDIWHLTLLFESSVRQMEGVDSANYEKTRAAIKRLRTALEGAKK